MVSVNTGASSGRSPLVRLSVGAALLIGMTLAAQPPQPGSTVETLLEETMGLSAADLRALNTGSAVVKSLDTPIREELAHVGAVFIDAPPDLVVERFRDIVAFENGPGVPHIGRFGTPARLEDLDSLTLPATDISALPKCRPGDCDVKLSAAAMRQFRDNVDWSSPHAVQQANGVSREMILELVRAYQAEGNQALGHYEDDDEPLAVAEHFQALLANTDQLPAHVPDLLTYLADYPRGRPAGVEDFFYWSVVDFGLKLTVRVSHVMIYPLAAGQPSGITYAIAIKQLWASHYFHTTLELRFLVADDRHSTRTTTSLISLTRSRSDGMTGFKGLFLRPIIGGRSRDAVRRYLEHVKHQVERSDPAAV